MRRKVEEGNELKRQLRKLEEKNSQYIQQNMELEEVRHLRKALLKLNIFKPFLLITGIEKTWTLEVSIGAAKETNC